MADLLAYTEEIAAAIAHTAAGVAACDKPHKHIAPGTVLGRTRRFATNAYIDPLAFALA